MDDRNPYVIDADVPSMNADAEVESVISSMRPKAEWKEDLRKRKREIKTQIYNVEDALKPAVDYWYSEGNTKFYQLSQDILHEAVGPLRRRLKDIYKEIEEYEKHHGYIGFC